MSTTSTTTASSEFRLSIGAKRQLTLPSELLEQLQVPERGELLVQVIGDHAVITPMVSVPRARLPEDLRRTFESRRGARSSDIPLAQLLKEVGYEKRAQKAVAPRRLSVAERVDRLTKLTPNEKAAFQQARAASRQRAQQSPVQSGRAQAIQSAAGRKVRAAVARQKAASAS